MTEQKHQHHHHHHHHYKVDGATKFKQQSLLAIKRRKIIEKWLKRILIVVAIIMAIAVVLAYTVF